MSALSCGRCGAGLPPPDAIGRSVCVYCGAEHRDRTSATLPAALVDRSSQIDLGGALENAARIPMTDESVLDLLREHFDASDAVFVCPHVPPRKEGAARLAHAIHLPNRERVLALYDASWFGPVGHDEGFVVTTNRICWKNPRKPANSIEWRDLAPEEIFPEHHRLYLGNDAVDIHDDALRDACADAFHVLSLSSIPAHPTASGCVAAVSPRSYQTDATRPPAHTTSFAHYASHAEHRTPDRSCWHCHTPLWAETPQCSYCGALPTTAGWLRTG